MEKARNVSSSPLFFCRQHDSVVINLGNPVVLHVGNIGIVVDVVDTSSVHYGGIRVGGSGVIVRR
jgi:hypothetical protein